MAITDFVYPPSVQSDLFGYLKPEQQKLIRPILRVIKHSYQEQLCAALVDYLETGQRVPPADHTLECLYDCITEQLTPLRSEGAKVDDGEIYFMSLSEILGKLFPDFKGNPFRKV